MKQQLNEIKRMQQLAGIVTESSINEDNLEEGFKEWLLAGLITLGTIGGGMKVYQMDKEAEADKKAQIEYYDNILSKSYDKMTDQEKTSLGVDINEKTKDLQLGTTYSKEDTDAIFKNYADKYVRNHPNEFSVSAQDGSLHWKFEQAASY
jgi:hypothetical protein